MSRATELSRQAIARVTYQGADLEASVAQAIVQAIQETAAEIGKELPPCASAQRLILLALRGRSLRCSEVERLTGIRRGNCHRSLALLIKAGHVVKTGTKAEGGPWYRLSKSKKARKNRRPRKQCPRRPPGGPIGRPRTSTSPRAEYHRERYRRLKAMKEAAHA